jgi:hypothetical protein
MRQIDKAVVPANKPVFLSERSESKDLRFVRQPTPPMSRAPSF